jgi:hypothetical protein
MSRKPVHSYTGERSHRILAPTADVTHAAGEIAILGAVDFV